MHCQHHLVPLADLEHLLTDDATGNRLAHVLDDLAPVDTRSTIARLIGKLNTVLGLLKLQVVIAHQQPAW